LVLGVLLAGMAASPARAADTKSLAVTAVVLSRSSCQFSTSTAATLDFGTLNPASGSTVVQSTSFNARCTGSANPATFLITQNSGLYKTGPDQNRMRHVSAATELIPYTLAISPSSGTVPKNQTFPVTVTGKVLGPGYQNAQFGNYSDTVVLTINP
jgi:spore coat protein U-like protein